MFVHTIHQTRFSRTHSSIFLPTEGSAPTKHLHSSESTLVFPLFGLPSRALHYWPQPPNNHPVIFLFSLFPPSRFLHTRNCIFCATTAMDRHTLRADIDPPHPLIPPQNPPPHSPPPPPLFFVVVAMSASCGASAVLLVSPGSLVRCTFFCSLPLQSTQLNILHHRSVRT